MKPNPRDEERGQVEPGWMTGELLQLLPFDL